MKMQNLEVDQISNFAGNSANDIKILVQLDAFQGCDCTKFTWDCTGKVSIAKVKGDNLIIIVASDAMPMVAANVDRALDDRVLVAPGRCCNV